MENLGGFVPKRVGVREIEPFHIYVTGATRVGTDEEGMRCAWLYLGRSKSFGLFTWLFIGSVNSMMSESDLYNLINQYGHPDYRHIEWTKHNKQVYRMVTHAALNRFIFNVNDERVYPLVREYIYQKLS